MEDVVPEIEGNKVPWRELVEVLVSALLGLYPGVMGVRWDPCSLIAATFLDSGNGLEMEILTKLLISQELDCVSFISSSSAPKRVPDSS